MNQRILQVVVFLIFVAKHPREYFAVKAEKPSFVLTEGALVVFVILFREIWLHVWEDLEERGVVKSLAHSSCVDAMEILVEESAPIH